MSFRGSRSIIVAFFLSAESSYTLSTEVLLSGISESSWASHPCSLLHSPERSSGGSECGSSSHQAIRSENHPRRFLRGLAARRGLWRLPSLRSTESPPTSQSSSWWTVPGPSRTWAVVAGCPLRCAAQPMKLTSCTVYSTDCPTAKVGHAITVQGKHRLPLGKVSHRLSLCNEITGCHCNEITGCHCARTP